MIPLRPSARRSLPRDAADPISTVRRRRQLSCSSDAVREQLVARRWQQAGRAIVLHNGGVSTEERNQIVLANCGPRVVLTAFSATTDLGLQGWERTTVHVLVPAGARVLLVPGIATRIHYVGDWSSVQRLAARPVHRMAPALIRAAGTLDSPRSACGLLAAAVQQRLTTAAHLLGALSTSGRVRHRRILLLAAHDIAQGAQALSEIDFGRLCRRHSLPPPTRQAVRVGPGGRRRYLDGLWELPDGRTVGVEVDGAMHLAAPTWYADQLRQNEIVLSGTLVLRYPSAVVRSEEDLVASQLAQALGVTR